MGSAAGGMHNLTRLVDVLGEWPARGRHAARRVAEETRDRLGFRAAGAGWPFPHAVERWRSVENCDRSGALSHGRQMAASWLSSGCRGRTLGT
jgi:hypothetical protein